jgi:predicted flap endonuclease-1-like 5' DNA nuclease
MPPWLLFVILIVVILIIIWILISGNPKEESPAALTQAEPAAAVVEEVEPVVDTVAPDDLKKIEGIGPKIAGLMTEHGILTFRQLAETSTEKMQSILDEAGIRIANPGTWAEQAKLAADGNWDALETLQDDLKGGRRE